MSDLTVNSSTTMANALNAISNISSQADSSDTSSSSDLVSEFSTIMMIMLLGSMSSQSSSDLSSDGSMGMNMNMNQLMAPLMLSLLEKLTSSKIEEATAQDVAATNSIEKTTDVCRPSGMPASGPITQGCHYGHVAIDIGVPIGTKIKSTMSGEVVYAGWNNEGYGNLVIVKNDKYTTYYGHLSKVPVNVGDQVEAGDVIGISGSTGNSTGPHLHYEVRVNGRAVDPSKYTSV